jgi:hypothetical protein
MAITVAALLPGVASAETWRGSIQCGIIPGMTTKPLFGDFEMSVDGARLTYDRPVHNADSASVSAIAESGDGTLADGAVTLRGGAVGSGYRYTATYQGKLDASRATLVGEQVWTGGHLPAPFHRACKITLTR